MSIAIDLQTTRRATKHLGSTENIMELATAATRLGGVGLVANHHLAPPRMLLAFEEEALLETIVRPGDHGACCLGVELALIAKDHLLRLERWE